MLFNTNPYTIRKVLIFLSIILILFSIGYSIGLFINQILLQILGNQMSTLFIVSHADNKTANLLMYSEVESLKFIPLELGFYTAVFGTILIMLVKAYLKD